jgi:Fe-S cluster biosynthesis and repair protein YggX
VKLNKEAEGLLYPPYPGELGKQIYLQISQEAWQQWLARQTMFINEYRLTVTDSEARQFLENQMKKFLFEQDESVPEAYRQNDV